MTTNQKRKEILETSKETYVNFDHKYFNNLTRRQVAFLCLIDKLNKANIIATNKEISSYLGITLDGSGVIKMIKNINAKLPGLIKLDYNTSVNHLGKIMSVDEDCYSKGRNIKLLRSLHVKGETYINLPTFAVSKRSCFMSSNELKVLAYIKAMPNARFSGLIRVIAKKLCLSTEIIKRALKRLVMIKAISKYWISVKHKLKNAYYRINTISLNYQWSYEPDRGDEAIEIKQKVPENSEPDTSWDRILESIGGSL